MNELKLHQEWVDLPEKEKDEILNIFLDKKIMHKFPHYMSMSNQELLKLANDSIRKNNVLKLEIAIKELAYLLKTTIFIKIPINKIAENIELDHNNNATISSNLFLLKEFGINSLSLNSFLNKSYNEGDFKAAYKEILNPKKVEKYIVYTYLMTDASGYVKIGKSKNVKIRIVTLRIGNPTLKIIGTLDKNIESKLHIKFKDKRIIGEWFSLSEDELLDIINEYKFIIEP